MREFEYTYWPDRDEPGCLVVAIAFEGTDETFDTIAGVQPSEFDVSDHGNVNMAPDSERYVREVAAELATANGGRLL
jgi:hypothetical protein